MSVSYCEPKRTSAEVPWGPQTDHRERLDEGAFLIRNSFRHLVQERCRLHHFFLQRSVFMWERLG